jgi:hypothetical protein
MGVVVDADDHLIRSADLSLTSACSMNGLVRAGSALRPQAGQIAVGGNSHESAFIKKENLSFCRANARLKIHQSIVN